MDLSIKKIILNSGWLFFDKAIRIIVSFFIAIWFARYLGPSLYGIWNYCTAFCALTIPLASLGLEAIVIRELVKLPEKKNEILGTTFILKLFAGITALLISILFIYIYVPDRSYILIVAIISFATPFLSLEVIDYYFQSRVESKYSVYARNVAFIISNAVKAGMILSQCTLVQFAWVSFLEISLSGLLLIVVFYTNKQNIFHWKFNRALAKKMLMDSAPLMLSGAVIMIYMRIDQIMLGNISSNEAVGHYSAAVKLVESWYLIPTIISSTLFPYFINSKNENPKLFEDRLFLFMKYMVIVSLIAAIVISIFSNQIILLLFGTEYSQASIILSINIWSAIFVFMGVVSQNWFIIENKQKHQLLRTSLGACINIVLNLYLIPIYGGPGAAVATLISQAVASYLANALSKNTREMFFMQSKALLQVFSLYFIYEWVKNNKTKLE